MTRPLYVRFTVIWAASALAESSPSGWKIGERWLPIPSGGSSELQRSIAETPQPDLSQPRFPEDLEEFIALMQSSDATQGEINLKRAKASGIKVERESIAGVPTFRVKPASIEAKHRKRLFLYVHGGAYVVGAGAAGLLEPIILVEELGIEVLSIDYRMPPDHPFPAAIDDVVAVYREVIKRQAPASIILGGTSAGGGLALAATLRFKEVGLPAPGAVYAGTAWADLTKTGDTLFTNEGIDRGLVRYEDILERPARLYAGKSDLKNPLISPVYGDFSGFPPTILLTGTRDLFLSDNARTHRRIRAAGSIAEIHVFEAMSHGGYLLLEDSPEFTEAYHEIDLFIDRHLEPLSTRNEDVRH